jgi:Mg2+ and Co2+ transporter CorA
MPTDQPGRNRPHHGEERPRMIAATAQRAGEFVDRSTPGDSKNKRLAQVFKIHPDTAKALRRGEGWTAQRFG